MTPGVDSSGNDHDRDRLTDAQEFARGNDPTMIDNYRTTTFEYNFASELVSVSDGDFNTEYAYDNGYNLTTVSNTTE